MSESDPRVSGRNWDLLEYGSRVVRRWQSARGSERETELVQRELAPVIFELRQRSEPADWYGTGREYREDIAVMYRMAGLDKEERDSLNAQVRYHVETLVIDVVDLQLGREARQCTCPCACGVRAPRSL